MTTPTTPTGLAQYDHLPPDAAVVTAWDVPGSHPAWHRQAQAEVRKAMPHLAHHLDAAPPLEVDLPAVVQAWTGPGQAVVRQIMPVLARALDRAAQAGGQG